MWLPHKESRANDLRKPAPSLHRRALVAGQVLHRRKRCPARKRSARNARGEMTPFKDAGERLDSHGHKA